MRRLYKVTGAGAALLLAMPMPACADEIVLTPSTSWTLDATPSGCALRRSFGTGSPPVFLEMQRFAPGDGFQLIASGDELNWIKSGTRLYLKYGSLPHHDEPVSFKSGETARENRRPIPTIFATSSLGDEDSDAKSDEDEGAEVTPQMEAQVREITLQRPGRSVILKTGPLDKPFAIMRQCTDALLKSWGLDPAVQNSLSRRAVPIAIRSWPGAIKYPTAAVMGGEQARVNFRMLVGADGSPTDCTVLRSYNDRSFDAVACRSLMKVARFEPALDAAGKPVPSFYSNVIVWSTSQGN